MSARIRARVLARRALSLIEVGLDYDAAQEESVMLKGDLAQARALLDVAVTMLEAEAKEPKKAEWQAAAKRRVS